MPKISCIVPNFNDSVLLPRALSSILAQGIEDIEIILIDDASTDESWRVIQEWAKKDSRIQIYRHEKNQGVIATLMHGFELAKGEYLYSGSANDYLLPGFFAQALAGFQKFPHAGFFCANTYLDNGRQQISADLGWGNECKYFSPGDLKKLKRPPGFFGQSVLFNKAFMPTNNQLSVELRGNFDWFIFMVSAYRKGFYYSPQCLSVATIADTNFSSREKTWKDKLIKINHFMNQLNRPEFEDVKKVIISSGFLSFMGLPFIGHIIKSKGRYCSWNLLRHLTGLVFQKIKRRFPFGAASS